MDTLVRITLRPAGAWTTYWQADTLLGALAAVWARFNGAAALRRDVLEPWQAGKPSVVISDAFPGDLLPAPALLSLRKWSEEQRKPVKKLPGLSPEQFRAAQLGNEIVLTETTADATPASVVAKGSRTRNAIDRAAGTAGVGEGNLFQTAFSYLSAPDATLSIYARAGDDGMAILAEALTLLGQTGFGANAAIGYGSFDPVGDPAPCPELDDVPDADGFVSLSTFQPAPSDPTDGYWRMFIKYGKLAPEFHHIHEQAPFKLPQIMLEPGACFRTGGRPAPFYGSAIEPERLFTAAVRRALAEHNVAPVQPAFALAVPMVWQKENDL